VETVECRLKKGLKVIFKYHVSRKKIIFVGILSPAEEIAVKTLLKNTRHMFVPEHLWLNEDIFNDKLSQTYFSKNDSSHEALQFKNTYHLVVMLNCSITNVGVESFKVKIPTVVLSNNLDMFNMTFSYKILGNYIVSKKKMKSHLFFMLLQSFLENSIH
jgi:hypothetical protein